MALLFEGARYVDSDTGYVYEVIALTPRVLYSPIKTYSTDVADSRIYQLRLEDFVQKFAYFASGTLLASAINDKPLTSAVSGDVLTSARN